MKTDFHSEKAALETGSSPEQRVVLRSVISPHKDVDLDILFRYVDKNIAFDLEGEDIIKDYVSLDIRLAWRPAEGIELSVVGQNLLAGEHQEYVQETSLRGTQIDRGVYGKLTWQFGQ